MANRNEYTFVKNVNGAGGPLLVPGQFQAGADQAIYEGMMLKHDGTQWVPLTADEGTASVLGVAYQKVESGDLAGIRPVIIPRPGDVFRYTLLSTDAQTPVIGTDLYVSNTNSDSFTLTSTAGSNIVASVVGAGHYPEMQGRQSQDASVDRGSTVRSLAGGEVEVGFGRAVSYYSNMWPA